MNDLKDISIRLAGVTEESVVDGMGIRFTVFTQGCPHACKGCHNPDTHDFNAGYLCTLSELADRYSKNGLLDGVTFSGGEPFCYPAECAAFAEFVHRTGGNVWTYSGYTYEELCGMAKKDPAVRNFLDQTDVLVDGRYIEEEKNLMLVFKGSENQRILDLKTMRKTGDLEPVILKF